MTSSAWASTKTPSWRRSCSLLPWAASTTHGPESGSFHAVRPPTAFARGSRYKTRLPTSTTRFFRCLLASSARRSDVAAYHPVIFVRMTR